MKTVLSSLTLLSAFVLGTLPALGQSIVGTWKRTGTVITYQNGKTDDVQATMLKAIPCAANITYEFTSGGVLKTNIPADCKSKMAAMSKMNADTRYTTSGNKITVQSPDPRLVPTMTQLYAVQGNTMTMTFDYADQPSVPNPTKAKSIVLTYTRQ